MKIEKIFTDNKSFVVGQGGAKEIREHEAQGEGDKWFYDVIYEDGNEIRLFNVVEVYKKGE